MCIHLGQIELIFFLTKVINFKSVMDNKWFNTVAFILLYWIRISDTTNDLHVKYLLRTYLFLNQFRVNVIH